MNLVLTECRGEPRVDSRLLAGRLQNKHKNVLSLVERYADKFKRFGIVPFETAKFDGRGRPERFTLLNENQSYFLLSLSRNTDHVVNLKAELVSAFAHARTGRALRHATNSYGQRLEIEAWDARSKLEATYGSRLMRERRNALRKINAARLQLDQAMQSLLFIDGLPN